MGKTPAEGAGAARDSGSRAALHLGSEDHDDPEGQPADQHQAAGEDRGGATTG